MKADQIAYRRATVVSLIGLAIQAVLALTTLLYALFGQDTAAATAFFYMLLGLPVWLGLALVWHQHRLERIEAEEAELYADAGGAQASVFQSAAEDLRVQSRRLAWMHRFLLPGISVAVGAGLVLVGLWRYRVGEPSLSPDRFVRPELTGWAVAVGIVIAAAGFIFARFVAGMAKQEVWANLRSGAAWSVGAALAGLALAIGHATAFAGSDLILRYLLVGIPIFMIVLGGEVFLNLVLNVYRPRRRGETPRPAFESRILGFISAPDRVAESVSDAINYQFGLNVSSTWFYRLLSRSLLSLLLLGGLTTWGLTTLAVVEPNEKGIVLQSGEFVRQVESGAHLKWPWPFQTVQTYPAHIVNEVQLGTTPHGDDEQGPILWSEDHGVDEVFTIVQSKGDGGNLALLAAEISVQYTVEDLREYYLLAADAEDEDDPDALRRRVLRAEASREVIPLLGSRSIDQALGEARSEINAELRRAVQKRFDAMDAGVEVLFAGIVGAHPPHGEQVAESFEGLVKAEQQRETTVAQAQAEAITTLATVAGDVDLARRIVNELDALESMTGLGPGASEEEIAAQQRRIEGMIDQAGGEAAGLLAQARADRWRQHMDVRSQAIRQAGRAALYHAAPQVYLTGLYLDALQSAAEDSRLFITTFTTPTVRANFEQMQSTFSDILQEQRATEQ